jgi:hypothetical protein
MVMRFVEEAGNRITLKPTNYEVTLNWTRRLPEADKEVIWECASLLVVAMSLRELARVRSVSKLPQIRSDERARALQS